MSVEAGWYLTLRAPRTLIDAGRDITAVRFAFHQPFRRIAAAISDLPPAVASWRDQIECLSEHASPCRYLAPAKWAGMRTSALAFCDQHGAEAHRLGWTAPQLFSVHPNHGTLRVDYCGALMVGGTPARGVEANRVLFEQTAAYRNRQGQECGVPVWELAARAR
ncbi:hypothetical protein [Methylobacterium sp. E-046]|uniref:hypothetical protein n=1 Tax=Methylobacterium sp. E-046 TaxID=2836576 RepID=UPI001FBAC6B3|nr:hypothetical protein [Methylobacterium sp. E-046]MCJ2102490.1 hypothetical protein [Methylobacterium sp. E-046]